MEFILKIKYTAIYISQSKTIAENISLQNFSILLYNLTVLFKTLKKCKC